MSYGTFTFTVSQVESKTRKSHSPAPSLEPILPNKDVFTSWKKRDSSTWTYLPYSILNLLIQTLIFLSPYESRKDSTRMILHSEPRKLSVLSIFKHKVNRLFSSEPLQLVLTACLAPFLCILLLFILFSSFLYCKKDSRSFTRIFNPSNTV